MSARGSLRAAFDRLAVAALLAIALAAAACSLDDRLPPTAATAARRDEDRAAATLRAHLGDLPGVVAAHVAVVLPVADPLARHPRAAPPRAAIALTLAAGADPLALRAAALAAGRTVLGPDATVAVDTLAAPAAPAHARTRTRAIAIAATLAIAAAALATALALARRRAYRARGIRPQ